MAIDFSFLRLSPSFAEAKNLGDPIYSDKNLWQHNQVCLLPTESYLQISNTAEGIAFDGDYLVEIIDCRETVKADVTDFIGIEEFTDRNGLQQIAFEIAPLGLDFHNTLLFLRFTHTTGDEIWYSNPFVLSSDHERNSSRFDYKGYGYFYGISYDRVDLMQSIRIRCFYDAPANQTEVSGYKQITRFNEISSNARTYFKSAYKVEYLTPFVIDRAQILLNHDVIYIDGVRITDKPVLEHGDRLGNTNIFTGNFTAGIDKSDTYTPTLQIIEALTLISYLPLGIYTVAGLPDYIIGAFNKNITLSTGTVSVFKDGVMTYEFDQDALTIENNGFTVNNSGYASGNGNYTIELSAGLFTSGSESSSAETWDFTVGDGEYDGSEYNNEYLTTV